MYVHVKAHVRAVVLKRRIRFTLKSAMKHSARKNITSVLRKLIMPDYVYAVRDKRVFRKLRDAVKSNYNN